MALLKMQKNTLVVAGSGIKFLAHLTHETKIQIKHASKILYLVNEPAIEEWIKNNNPQTESLYPFYIKHFRRIDCYKEISMKILSELSHQKLLCVVFYGHPTVFATPALEAAVEATKQGYQVLVLPAISAADCLFADLLINPGSGGCQSYEASEFLIKDKIIDASAHLILWQVGTIGAIGRPYDHNNRMGVELLIRKLNNYYDLMHPIIVYEAAQYPHFKPRIDLIPLKKLREINLSSLSTMYISPGRKAEINLSVLNKLNLKIKDLQVE